MATFSLSRGTFPAGSVVTVRLFADQVGLSAGVAASGAVVDAGEVPAAGSLIFSSLLEGATYVASAQVDGEWQHVTFTASGDADEAVDGGPVLARRYGVVADGVTDDTAALKEAISAARAAGRSVLLEAGRHRVTGVLTETTSVAPIAIQGAGKDLTTLVHDAGSTHLIGGTFGSWGSDVPLTVAAASGASSVTLSSTAGLAKDDLVLLTDTSRTFSGGSTNTPGFSAGEWARIRSVDSGTAVSFYGTLDYAYTTAATLKKGTLLEGLTVADLTIEPVDPDASPVSGQRGISFFRAKNVRVSNVRFSRLFDDALRMADAVNFTVEGCDFECPQDLEIGLTPYSIGIADSSTQGIVTGCTQRWGRHLVTSLIGAVTRPCPSYVVVSDCVALWTQNASFDTHGGGRRWTFDSCTAVSSKSSGFQVRAKHQRLVDCLAVSCLYGALVTFGGDDCDIYDFRAVDCDAGVYINSSERTRLRNVVIENPRTYGVLTDQDADFPTFRGLDFDDVLVTGNPSVAAFQFVGFFDYVTWRMSRLRAPDATTFSNGWTSTIASAATIAVPPSRDVWSLSGVVGVTTITFTVDDEGRVVTLLGQSGAVVNDGSNLKLVGNWAAAANATLTLVGHSGLWIEKGRSAP